MFRKAGILLLLIICLTLILTFIATAIREASWPAYIEAATAVLVTWLLLSNLRKKPANQPRSLNLTKWDKRIIAIVMITALTALLPALFLLARDAGKFM